MSKTLLLVLVMCIISAMGFSPEVQRTLSSNATASVEVQPDSELVAMSCDAEVNQCKSLCNAESTKVDGTCLSASLSTGTSFSCYIGQSASGSNPCSPANTNSIRVKTDCTTTYVDGVRYG